MQRRVVDSGWRTNNSVSCSSAPCCLCSKAPVSRLVSYVRENVPRIPGKVGQPAGGKYVKPSGGRRGTEADERGSRSAKREYEFGANVSDCVCA